jgi:hypothetical protein
MQHFTRMENKLGMVVFFAGKTPTQLKRYWSGLSCPETLQVGSHWWCFAITIIWLQVSAGKRPTLSQPRWSRFQIPETWQIHTHLRLHWVAV